MRVFRLASAILLAACGATLSGCLPMIAANVAGVAVDAAVGRPKPNEGSGSLAERACTARAEPYGAVHVIDTEQHTPSQIIVWGTVEKDGMRQSFRCTYGTKIESFRVRAIPK